MQLAEIRTMRQTCRAKVEDLLSRTASRELSTEENQMFTDLKAEGERLASLESRYAVLESFDKSVTPSIVRTPIVAPNANVAKLKALDFAFRNGRFEDGKQAADVPLQIQQSPVDAASAAAVATDFAFVDATGTFDVAAALGVTEYNRPGSNPLKITIQGAATAATTFVEGTAPTESAIPTFKDVTLDGKRSQNLTKISLESINNVSFNVVQAVTRSLVTGQLEKQNADFGAALKTACAANTHCLVDSGTNDAYYTLAALISKLPAIFQGPNNKFLLPAADLLACLNARDDQNRPLLDFSAGTLLGKPYVVSEDVDRVYFGNWSFGGYRSRTPLFVSVLRELYAQQGHVGYSAYQWSDFAFYAELTTLTKQPVLFSHLGASGA